MHPSMYVDRNVNTIRQVHYYWITGFIPISFTFDMFSKYKSLANLVKKWDFEMKLS